ncbi:hypothetical protein KWI11_26535, partial [Escherichia coli]|nr:hypothetical protein [Escherichia coli]
VSNDLTGTSVLPKLSSTDLTATNATVSDATITDLTVSGNSSVVNLNSSGKVTAVVVQADSISNPAGVSITNNTSIDGNLTVSGSVTPGSIDLSTTDVAAKSVTVTEGVTVNGNLTVNGVVDLSAAGVTVKSLTSTGPVVSNDLTGTSVLPKLSST